jgi:hypothetical protein
MESFIEMNNQIIIMSGILSVTLFLPTITANFLPLVTPNAFGQHVMFDRTDKGSDAYASDAASNNNMTDHDIVTVSFITGNLDSNAAPSSSMN